LSQKTHLLVVECDIAELLLDVADNLALGRGDHGVAALGHDLHEVVCEIAPGQVQTEDGMGKGVTLVDGDGVGDAISDVKDETGGATGSVEGKDGLDADVPILEKVDSNQCTMLASINALSMHYASQKVIIGCYQGRMTRGGHGLPKVSPRPTIPYLSTP
jgi:hypothetical protein